MRAHNDLPIRSRRTGNALLTVMMLIAGTAAIALMVAQLSKTAAQSRRVTRMTASQDAVVSRLAGLRQDPYGWAKALTQAATNYKNCFVNGSYTACDAGTAGTTDTRVTEIADGRTVIQSVVFDRGGFPLGGTEAAPVTFDQNGEPCVGQPATCHYEMASYLVRENPAGDPGKLLFVFRLRRNPASYAPGELRESRAIYDAVYMGEEWKLLAAPQPDACAAGQAVASIGADGKPVCFSPTEVTCPPSHYLGGFSTDGKAICLDLGKDLY